MICQKQSQLCSDDSEGPCWKVLETLGSGAQWMNWVTASVFEGSSGFEFLP